MEGASRWLRPAVCLGKPFSHRQGLHWWIVLAFWFCEKHLRALARLARELGRDASQSQKDRRARPAFPQGPMLQPSWQRVEMGR